MTAKEEIYLLERLSQAAAAWLLGMSPRRLRETDCPRNRDGTYRAQDVIAWRLDHLTAAEIAAAVNRLNAKQIIAVADAVCERLTRLLQ